MTEGNTVAKGAELLVEDIGLVRILTLNRPSQRNALSPRMVSQLGDAISAVASEPGIRAAIVTGAGDTAFAAGADILHLLVASPREAERAARAATDLHARLRCCPKPIIAAINGYCFGAGLELALACDIRIAGTAATFALPEIRLGILPGGGGTVHLARLIGSGPARAMCYTGARVDAERAFALGLVTEVVSPDALMRTAVALAQQLAEFSTNALWHLKQVFTNSDEIAVAQGEALERKAFALCFADAGQREGMTAFLEKRKPRFR
jgi:enoyl-CoA hydratase